MPARPDQREWPAILKAMRKACNAMAELGAEGRNSVLCGLLTQEVCKLPASQRQAALAEIIAELPEILRSTEQGMRMALNENARKGL